MATFAEIQEEIRNIMDIPLDDLNEEEVRAWEDYKAELEQARGCKIDNFAQFVRMETEHARAIRAEVARLEAKARAVENKIASLRGLYARVMAENDLKKVNGEVYKISLSKNTSLECLNVEALEEARPELVRKEIKFSPMKDEIKKLLKAGEEIPGCMLQTKETITIR